MSYNQSHHDQYGSYGSYNHHDNPPDFSQTPSSGTPFHAPSPSAAHPDPYLQQSQYSQFSNQDSYYSQTSTNVQRHSPVPPIESHEMYNQPAPPSSYQPPMQQQQLQPRPSFTSSYGHDTSYTHDYYDDSKSFTSTTNLNAKEWGVGDYVPSMPMATPGGYPPRPPPTPYGGGMYGAPSPVPSSRWGGPQWHQVRNQLLERRVVKTVPLTNGNLIMDVPVPRGVIPTTRGLGLEQEEMDKMRYSAATCDPDDFMRNKFNLRQYLWGRKTELFVSQRRPIQAITELRSS